MRQHPIAIRGIRADSSANRRGQIRRGSTAAPLGSAVARWILAGLAGLAGCPGSGEFGDDTSEVDDDSALPDDDATADDDTTPQPDDDTTPLPDDDTTPPPDDDTTPPPDDDTTAPPDDDTSVWTGTAEVHWLTDEALAYIYLEYEGGFDDYPQFGRFVVSTADVSGDEYADVLVAQPYSGGSGGWWWYGGIPEEPPYRLYFGPRSGIEEADAAPDARFFPPTQPWGRMGFADIDGDGQSDVYLPGETGVAFFLGPVASGDRYLEEADLFLQGDVGWFDVGGDFNGDGNADIIAEGTVANDAGGWDYGLYLVPGPLDGTTDLGSASSSVWLMSRGVSTSEDPRINGLEFAGDVNGDGNEDILVGCQTCDGYNGKVWLRYGPTESGMHAPPWEADAVFVGDENHPYFGATVGPAGDLDRDGLDEFYILCPQRYEDLLPPDKPSAELHLIRGASSPYPAITHAADVPDRVVDVDDFGLRYLGAFGSVSPSLDVTGDGRPDLLLGIAQFHMEVDGVDLAGGTFVWSGDVEGDVYLGDAAELWVAAAGYSFAGEGVSAGGDVDGDGRPDFVVGAPWDGVYGSIWIAHGSGMEP